MDWKQEWKKLIWIVGIFLLLFWLPTGWERPTLWQRGVETQLDRNVFFSSRRRHTR